MKKKIILILFLTLFIFSFNYFIFHKIIDDCDEIWNFGFSYNIAKGAIPYRDFNMVVLPLYSLLMSIPLRIFSNSLFIFHLFNAIYISIIIAIISDNEKDIAIVLALFMIIVNPIYGYNCFIVMLLILILYLQSKDYKYKEEIIGILLGCILATKQNIGIVLFFPYIFHSKHKLKSILCYLVPITLVAGYLVINNALFECIDYCFLGLRNFSNNFLVTLPILVVFDIVIITYLIIKYRKTKDINYIYLACFQVINYPLFEIYHFIIGTLPVIYYLIVTENNKYINYVFIIFPIIIILIVYVPRMINNGINPSSINNFKYRNVTDKATKEQDQLTEFIYSNKDSRIFIFNFYSYFIKISLDKKLDKFDLINIGNMGADESKYIKEMDKICSNKKCIFILDEKAFTTYTSQINPIVRDYVLNNYDYCGKINSRDSYYCNKK